MIPLILIAIGIFLIVHNYKKINKTTSSFEFTLNEKKADLDDYKLELGLLRKDIGESLTELQQEITNIKINMNMVNDTEKEYDNILDSDISNIKFDVEEKIATKKEIDIKNDIDVEEHIGEDIDKKQKKNKEVDSGVISEINFKNTEVFDKSINNEQTILNESDNSQEFHNEDEREFISKSNGKKVSGESNKQHTISNLIKQGLTDEEICKALSVSKGEVLLVRNLFKN
ncbi:DUF6115 domain-containing protein [Clostridium taeniosporum]|uniref:Uncharacterized protein n=1 Tax=Clostridium taeniosporum TaxID=394958 RepID=A0A1D7XHX5_9CLOT|nr:hypothetical protein [Clostridium taeniosporum]AOR22948.1 hypothetical protein BGI42_04105 [Clostridium taeniosporum]